MIDERNPQPPGAPQSPGASPATEQRPRRKQRKGPQGKEHMGDKPRNPARPDIERTDQDIARRSTESGGMTQPGQPPGQGQGPGFIKK